MPSVITEPAAGSNPHIGRITILRGDIAAQAVDAVAAALPAGLQWRGAIADALKAGAGPQLDAALRENIYRPRPGDVYALPGFGLPCRHVFFCIVPAWRDDFERHDRYLVHAVRRALETAREMNLRRIALPPLCAGKGGYPKARAARLMVRGILDRLSVDLEEVRLVCRGAETESLFRDRLYSHGWAEGD